VEGNRKQAMLARQRVSFKLEEDIARLRAQQEQYKRGYGEWKKGKESEP